VRYDTIPPDPAMVRAAREASGLTLAAAGALVHVSAEVWRTWEAPIDSTRHRQMSAAHWELFQRKVPAAPNPNPMTEAELNGWAHGSDAVKQAPLPKRKKT
jgi:hypothetical protein